MDRIGVLRHAIMQADPDPDRAAQEAMQRAAEAAQAAEAARLAAEALRNGGASR
jgi:hypothetical protein